MAEKRYEIITNSKNRSILVINSVVNIDEEDDLAFEDFDAVFVNTILSVMDGNMLALRLASPLYSEKCRYKPCFVTQRLKGWVDADIEQMIDGYAYNPTDASVAQTIEDIYANMVRYNFLLGTDPVLTHAEEIYRLCRFAITRGQFSFSSRPTPGLSSGWMALYYSTVWNAKHELMQKVERNYFLEQLKELGYVRRKRFVDKIHVCPHCNRSQLLFFETCPKCNTSNIREEDVIHHFRCANVAPASAYEWDGELRCPKCHKMLLHIGVDYDKPSSVYTCNECHETFMYPGMKVLCTSCGSTLITKELVADDVEEYEFTPDGIRAFANNDVNVTIRKTQFYGHSTMRDFEDYLRECAKDPDFEDVIIVSRFHIYDPDIVHPRPGEMVPAIVKRFRRLFNYKSALHGNDYYFLCRVKPGQITEMQNAMEFELKSEFEDYARTNPEFRFDLVSSQILHQGENVNDFLGLVEANISERSTY